MEVFTKDPSRVASTLYLASSSRQLTDRMLFDGVFSLGSGVKRKEAMIRAATKLDLPSIWELNVIVQESHALHVPTLFKKPSDGSGFLDWFGKVMVDPTACVLIAENSGSAVGYLYAQEVRKEESWVRPELHYFMLHHIVVKEEYQRQGLGDGLMKELIAEANRREIKRVELDVWNFNHNAQKFFARYGFAIFNQRMDVVLKEEPGDSMNSTLSE